MSKAAILRMRKKLEAAKSEKQGGLAQPAFSRSSAGRGRPSRSQPRSASAAGRGRSPSLQPRSPALNPTFAQPASGEIELVEDLLAQTQTLLQTGGRHVWVKWLYENEFNDAAKAMQVVQFDIAARGL